MNPLTLVPVPLLFETQEYNKSVFFPRNPLFEALPYLRHPFFRLTSILTLLLTFYKGILTPFSQFS